MKEQDTVLTKEQTDGIFMALWDKNIFEKHKNEPPSFKEFVQACTKAKRKLREEA